MPPTHQPPFLVCQKQSEPVHRAENTKLDARFSVRLRFFLSCVLAFIRSPEHTTSHARCHRCKVLSIDCSYKVANPAQQPSPPKTSSGSPLSSPTAIAGLPCNASTNAPRLWSFVTPEGENVDWSQPMLAIQQLTLLPIL